MGEVDPFGHFKKRFRASNGKHRYLESILQSSAKKPFDGRLIGRLLGGVISQERYSDRQEVNNTETCGAKSFVSVSASFAYKTATRAKDHLKFQFFLNRDWKTTKAKRFQEKENENENAKRMLRSVLFC